jgi:cellulose synthase/poly-beta-1,6-N-acetylglucosamine synthase-like glycosyltransferase
MTSSVTVIVCAYTDERLADIKEAVNSILGQNLTEREVVVSVDHNPMLADALQLYFRSNVMIVRNDGVRGLSETRNVGIRASHGDIVAFIDDDAVADEDWLRRVTAPFEDPDVAATGGTVVPLWIEGDRPVWFPEELDWIVGCTYTGLPVRDGRTRNVLGCNMAFRRSIFDKVGDFAAELGRKGKMSGVGEEADICLRITNKVPGSKILYIPDAIVRHKVPPWRLTLGYLWHRAQDEGLHKKTVETLSRGLSVSPLSTENSYLRYLLTRSLPKRLRRLYKANSLPQVGAILACISAAGTGYILATFREFNQGKPRGAA